MTLATRLWRSFVFQKRAENDELTRIVRSRAGQKGNEIRWSEHKQDQKRAETLANRLSKQGSKGMLRRWRHHRIERHMPLVEQIARQCARMFPQVPIEDLISAGYVGLVDAADRLDPARQSEFPKYAWFRVRGAIIDAHKRQAYREEQHESVEQIRDRMGFLPSTLARDSGPLPDEIAERRQLERTVALLIAELPEQDAALMRMVMAGSSVPAAARELGRSPAWGRARLAAARDRVGAGVLLR